MTMIPNIQISADPDFPERGPILLGISAPGVLFLTPKKLTKKSMQLLMCYQKYNPYFRNLIPRVFSPSLFFRYKNVVGNFSPKGLIPLIAVFEILAGAQALARTPAAYQQDAARIARLASPRAKQEVIAKTLKLIDQNLAKHFPSGPFKREDLIAMALVESSFYHRTTGGIGERGLFQIRPEWFRAGVDGYQVTVNVDMACRVLKRKYATAKRIKSPLGLRKSTIILYNGYARGKDGKIKQGYWRAFVRQREKVCRALNPGRPV